MGALIEKAGTVVPSEEDTRLAAESSRILAANRPDHALRVQLEDGRVLTLPVAAARLLEHLLTEMAHGNAVTLIPVHAELTTQEAADYLNVSRPYLVRLLEENAIRFHKVGTHRRVRFQDLKAYKDRMDAKREMAMNELVAEAQELGLGY
ncbi:excisionase family DNA binding protein [Skermanella aerolata]|uniref:helix-turn-helix domain-containing protein n=1 Tax=Skermanella aerolata TaxID=393310 RepID=UPI003D20F72E